MMMVMMIICGPKPRPVAPDRVLNQQLPAQHLLRSRALRSSSGALLVLDCLSRARNVTDYIAFRSGLEAAYEEVTKVRRETTSRGSLVPAAPRSLASLAACEPVARM
jgi:hypothetical protein